MTLVEGDGCVPTDLDLDPEGSEDDDGGVVPTGLSVANGATTLQSDTIRLLSRSAIAGGGGKWEPSSYSSSAAADVRLYGGAFGRGAGAPKLS